MESLFSASMTWSVACGNKNCVVFWGLYLLLLVFIEGRNKIVLLCRTFSYAPKCVRHIFVFVGSLSIYPDLKPVSKRCSRGYLLG